MREIRCRLGSALIRKRERRMEKEKVRERVEEREKYVDR